MEQLRTALVEQTRIRVNIRRLDLAVDAADHANCP